MTWPSPGCSGSKPKSHPRVLLFPLPCICQSYLPTMPVICHFSSSLLRTIGIIFHILSLFLSILDTARGNFLNVNESLSKTWNQGHLSDHGLPDVIWSGLCLPLWPHPLLLPSCPYVPATKMPISGAFYPLFLMPKTLYQVLCMAGFFLNFRSQLKCHLLSQVIPKVPTILPQLPLCYTTLIFSSYTFIRVYNKFMYLFVIVCISQQDKPVLFRISLSVLVSVSL